ncbi:MAG: alpha-hydroxy-acid oxidizing protein [Rhizobiales bacterium]|nr:alpha-hydroxy-acid oxidizing protein [Hyphomicrobiales bacterium]
MSLDDRIASRRKFLQFLAASPLLAGSDLAAMAAENPSLLPDPMLWSPRTLDRLIKSPKEAISIFDFEPVMARNVPPAHFGYMASGIDDETTLRANREGFQKFVLRPRRLVDVSKVDTSVELFGIKYSSPVGICPTGGHKGYHPEGETAVATAAKLGNHLMLLSTQATTSVEDVVKARGAPIWFQLYATNKFEVATHHVKRAERAGCVAVAVTVDRSGGRNQETLFRLRPNDTRNCSQCHDRSTISTNNARKPAYDGLDVSGLQNIQSSMMSWDYIQRLRDQTKMKIVLKGIITWEDAELARKNGIDAIIVSNHGGRSEDGGPSTIESLPEIIAAAGGMPVLIDSGFRRGSDIVKALCMGATAVCVGRPYLWGLGAFGQPGVERVLELLRTETRSMMQQMGAPAVKHLVPAMVRRA